MEEKKGYKNAHKRKKRDEILRSLTEGKLCILHFCSRADQAALAIIVLCGLTIPCLISFFLILSECGKPSSGLIIMPMVMSTLLACYFGVRVRLMGLKDHARDNLCSSNDDAFVIHYHQVMRISFKVFKSELSDWWPGNHSQPIKKAEQLYSMAISAGRKYQYMMACVVFFLGGMLCSTVMAVLVACHI
ncbi:hypothetical protein [Pedobacter sp.]|uniref:hypothetical protein n=1 Tax=Pedobacter sp. TaxID=1411316 RepID=UPI003C4CCDA7